MKFDAAHNYPDIWTYKKRVQFKCIPHEWYDERIRVNYVVDHHEHKSTFEISHPQVDKKAREEPDSLLETSIFKQYLKDVNERKMLFLRSQTFTNGIGIEFDQEVMKGVKLRMRIFSNPDLKDKPDKYNGWKFSNTSIWDNLNN